jgi:hypothetical protein
MRTLPSLLCVVLLAGGALLGPVSPASSAAPPPVVEVTPRSLPRGDAPRVPYLEGTVVVDDDRRLATGGSEVRLLGRSGDDVLVAVAYADDRSQRVLRLRPDGTRAVVAKPVDIGTVLLSADGSTLVADRSRLERSTVRVIDAWTGAVTARRAFTGYVEAHDVAGGEVALVRYRPDRTIVWRTGADRTRPVLRRAASYVDLDADRITWFDGDPYQGGCTVLARLSLRDEALWGSCKDAVVSISPNGRRLLTLHKLTDGVGPGELRVRRANGRLVATYEIERGWFPHWQWESGRALLIQASGPRHSAWVRCVDGACERATRLRPAEQP